MIPFIMTLRKSVHGKRIKSVHGKWVPGLVPL